MASYAVIGASRGIGLELVRQLSAHKGNTVIVTVRNIETSTHLNEFVQQSQINNIHIIEADVANHSAMERAAVETAKITGGSLDILIHNAARMEMDNRTKGLLDYETPEKLDAEFVAAFQVNVLGVIHSVNAFLPLLRKGQTRKIMIISSEAGDCGFVWKLRMAMSAAYGTTKAAVNMVATKYAAQLEGEGFTVVSVSPGMVDVSGTSPNAVPRQVRPNASKILARLQDTFPNAAILTPEESSRRLISFLDSVSPAESGVFHRSEGYA